MNPVRRLAVVAAMTLTLAASPVWAAVESYKIDPTHSFVTFSIHHLGYSLLQGRFNTISGTFSYDADAPDQSAIKVEVETTSVDSNHAERDKHLRGKDFLDVDQFPKATFTSTKFSEKGKEGTLEGTLTLHGVSKPVVIPITFIGAGKDPWGGYRRGYHGKLTIKRSDFGINRDLGPAAAEMELGFFIEGIKQ